MATDDVLLRVLAETASARREVDSLRAAFEIALGRMEAAAKRPDFDPLSAEARILRREVEATGAKFIEAFNRADKEIKETAQHLHAARTGVRQLDAELRRLGGAGQSVSGLVSTLGELRAGLAAVGGAAVAVRWGERIGRAIGESAGDVQLARIQLEALRAQLDAAAGSSEAGGRAFDFARDQALRLGQDLAGTVQSLARFEAATRQTNLTLAERRDLFQSVAEAGRVMQLSEQRVQLAFLALEQIASKGVASMEELRRQLGDQIPGVLPGLARQLGVTDAELIKMIESGDLLASEVLPALTRYFKEISESGLAAALETDAAALGKIRTQLVLLKAEIAEGFSEETSAGIGAVSDGLERAGPAARLAGEAFGALGNYLAALPLREAGEGISLLLGVLDVLGLKDEALALSSAILADATKDRAVATEGAADASEAAAAAAEAEAKRLAELKAQLDAAAKAEREFAEKLFGSKEALDLQTTQLTYAVGAVVKWGQATQEQIETALKAAEKLADGYRVLGEEVPIQLQAIIDKLEEEARAAQRAFALSAEGMREFREELLGSVDDVDTTAAQLLLLIQSIEGLGGATTEQRELIRSQIQDVLDDFARLGKEPPEAFASMAAAFGVTTSRIEAEVDKQRKAIAALVADFAGLADKIKSSRAETGAAKDLAEQRAELEALQNRQREGGALTVEELNRLGELETSVSRLAGEVEGLGTSFDNFGDQATASIDDVDKAIRDLIRGNQEALASLPAATQEAVFNTLGGLQNLAQQGLATEEAIRDAMLKIGDRLQEAGVDTADFAQAMEDAGGSGLNLTQELAKLGEGTGDAADKMQEYRDRVDEAKQGQEDSAEAAKELGTEMKKAADSVVAETERMLEPLGKVKDLLHEIVQLCQQWQACIAGTA